MDKAVQKLVENYNLNIKDPLIEKYVQEVDKIEKISLEKYHRPTELKPQSVGSYLWGNRQNYYGDVSRECSSLAIGSLGYNDHCVYIVWWYNKGILEKITEVPGKNISSRAYIYVDSDWVGFTKSDLKKLSEADVELVSVFVTTNSVHRKIVDMQPPQDFLIDSDQIKEIQKDSTSFYFTTLLAILLIVLMILKNK